MGSGTLVGARVLVVDDDIDARQLVGLVLEMSGGVVRCAESAEEAFAALDAFSPDVLVSDLSMPSASGHDLILAIRRRSDVHGRLPAVAVSAACTEASRARECGFDAFIAKPLDPAKLVETVATLLAAR